MQRPKHDTDELPIVLENGPTAGDAYEAIHEGECGNCGYDRIMVSRKYGEGVERCMLCEASTHDGRDEWELPATDSDDLRHMREYAEKDGPVVKHGEFGPVGPYRHGHEVFGYTDTELIKVFRHGRDGTDLEQTALRCETLDGVLDVLERSEGYVTEWVNEHLDGKSVGPDTRGGNPNAIHIGELTFGGMKSWKSVRLAIKIDHILDESRPLYIPPERDGVVV